MFSRLKKTHQIHKDYLATQAPSKDEREEQENAFSFSDQEDDDLIESLLPDVPMKNPLKCDPRHISNLTEVERNQIKKEHPEMSEYFFLSQRDKTKYFHLVNQKYSSEIRPSQPPGSAPKKKTISFKTRFQVKTFNQDENCEEGKDKKSWMELYRAEKKKKLKLKKRRNK